MRPSRWVRLKRWVCMRFNHKLKFSHRFGGRDIFICSRCKVINDKQAFDAGREVWHARNGKRDATKKRI